ncbi:MAG: acetylglutamate kinase [Spirochaetaceae bacterium 4572_7]|nr:MAG: acetylglutamate kinase [Spirochaetaceae bacterium 4572_7]
MKPIILIKTGGKAAVLGKELNELILEIKLLKKDYDFIVVHGGGAEVTKASEVYGLKTTFIHGKRITTDSEMDIVDEVLAGRINTRLVRAFEKNNISAIGLSGNDGQIFTGESVDSHNKSRTGRVTKTDPKLLKLLLSNNYTPVISSVSMDDNGKPLNINADDAALAVALSVSAEKVIFISDIPGILKNSNVLERLTPYDIKLEIESGVISGGMIPKVTASAKAVKASVKNVVIGDYQNSGDLLKLLNSLKGSTITKEIL